MAAYRILRYVHCPKYQMLCSGINDLMSQVLKQVTVLVIFCVMLKQFCLPTTFVLEYKSVWKINVGEFSIQCSLSSLSITTLCLCVSFLSLFFLHSISNPHTTTLEYLNLPWLDHGRSHLQKGGSQQWMSL